MRIIDADALLKKKDKIYIPPEDPEETWCFGAEIEVIHLDDVKEAPTIDPEELRHKGRWIERRCIIFDDELTAYRCSNCELTNEDESMFCPNCGCRMNGGNK